MVVSVKCRQLQEALLHNPSIRGFSQDPTGALLPTPVVVPDLFVALAFE